MPVYQRTLGAPQCFRRKAGELRKPWSCYVEIIVMDQSREEGVSACWGMLFDK